MENINDNYIDDELNKYSIDDCNYIPILTNVSSYKDKIQLKKIYSHPFVNRLIYRNLIHLKTDTVSTDWFNNQFFFSYLSDPPKNIDNTFYFIRKNNKQIFLIESLDADFDYTKFPRDDLKLFVE